MIAAKRVLINCSNLHNGGGIAVATSVVDCLSKMNHGDLSVSVLLSTSVAKNLTALGTDLSVFELSKIEDHRGLNSLWSGLTSFFANFDVVFTVFGPAYYLRRNTRHLFGFAQPNIIYPNSELNGQINICRRIFLRIKYEVQAFFFSRADELVVELEHVKEGLSARALFRRKQIHIVYSAVHTIFKEPNRWAPVSISNPTRNLRLGLIARNYPHKNLRILPFVKQCLITKYNMHTEFFVTFPQAEWVVCDDFFKRNTNNVGELSLNQCPSFYSLMDGVIFPSLLECFSAVPLEAMVSGRPLFASNLPFIRDVCDDHCNYFDPLDASDIADVIFHYYSLSQEERDRRSIAARSHAGRFPGPDTRAEQYLNLVRNLL
jgi:glycosyltransferase involved in cell wall biosynthesis